MPIRQQDVTIAHKTLGVYMIPTGNESAQVKALLENSCRISNLVLSLNFSQLEILMAYKTIWYPVVSYSLAMTTMTSKQLRHVHATTATQSFLAKMGINCNFPQAVTFGPLEYGGLNFPDLLVEQGISQIRTFMENMYHDTELGKMIKICLQTLQAEAGSALQVLQDPTVELSYLTPCWLTSTRTFMGAHQILFQLSDRWNFFLSQERDTYLMDLFCCSGGFSPMDLKHLNAKYNHSPPPDSVRPMDL